jgi:hypothetical protein
MIEFAGFGVLGFALGFLLKLMARPKLGKIARFLVAVAVLMAVILGAVFLGAAPNAAGRWGVFAAIGAFAAAGSEE